MQAPPISENEVSRLASLKALDILDTDSETAYDQLTKLAAYICNVPISLVSLVDDKRQWFKSAVGLGASETPRDISFCGHAIQGNDIFEISDSTKDPRFADNPLVTGDPNVIFYAGVPLSDEHSHNLGTLCVIDNKPRQLSEDQRDALRTLADQAQTHFKLRRIAVAANMAADNASREVRAKATLLANMSHEIREPLQGIVSATELLKNSALSERQLRLINILDKSGESLSWLINDVMDLSTVEAGRLKVMLEPFNPAEVMHNLAQDQRDSIEERGNTFELITAADTPTLLLGDVNRIRQILTQLLRQANNMTSNGHITLQNHVDTTGDSVRITFSVIDSGVQIAEDILSNLFDRFEQNDARDASVLGTTGIGLAIAAKLTRLMNGVIEASSSSDQGSVFTVAFDMQPA